MSDSRAAARMRTLARRLLDDGAFGDEHVRRSGTIAEPLLVADARREPHSWLVGITDGDRLVSVFQFLTDGTVLRYSTYQRRPGDCSQCPLAADWLEAGTVRARASDSALKGEHVEDLWLTFDRSPDRVVWAAILQNSAGRTRTVFVAGSSVYEPPSAQSFG